jgi:hypothetical protein
MAPAARRPVNGRRSSIQTTRPQGIHATAATSIAGTANGPSVGTSQWCSPVKKPLPASQLRHAASLGTGAAATSSSTGTSPT